MALFKKKQNVKSPIDKKLKTKPKSAQDTIPYIRSFNDGIFEVEPGVFSKSYFIDQVDFATADEEERIAIRDNQQNFLNSISPDMALQMTIINSPMDKEEFMERAAMKSSNDGQDDLRQEYNDILDKNIEREQNGLEQFSLYTFTVNSDNIERAKSRFNQVDKLVEDGSSGIVSDNLSAIPSNPEKDCKYEVNQQEKLSILYDIFHPDKPNQLTKEDFINGERVAFFDLKTLRKKGRSTKDAIAGSFDFYDSETFKIGNYYARCLYVEQLPTGDITTRFLEDMRRLPFHMLQTYEIETMSQQAAIKMVKRHHGNIRTSLTTAQQKAAKNFISADLVNPDLTDANEEADALRRVLTQENQKVFLVTGTYMIISDEISKLDEQTKSLVATASGHMVDVQVLRDQQEHGLCSVLPLGLCKIHADHLMITENVATLLPYYSVNYNDPDGIYYGVNQIDNSLIMFDRTKAKNYNGIVLGESGAGKGVATKRTINALLMKYPNDVHIIIDPDREYSLLGIKHNPNSSIIRLAPGAGVSLNPMDMDLSYADDGDPIALKCDFISSQYELMAGREINPFEKTVLLRAITQLFEPYINLLRAENKTYDSSKAPTYRDLNQLLKTYPETEAQRMTVILEPYATGNYNLFQNRTNVDVNKRLTIYDIKDIGEGLKNLGLSTALNDAWNRALLNAKIGKRTWIWVDEAHLLTRSENSAKLLQMIFKRGRKMGCATTLISQDPEDLLATQEGRAMFTNSAFTMLLGQKGENIDVLKRVCKMSKAQTKFITNAEIGSGILYTGRGFVPFRDKMEKGTKSYELFSTDPKELEEQAM